MKETKRGLESEDPIEAAIISSGQFKRILEEFVCVEVNVTGDNKKAVFKTNNPSEIHGARQLITDIREGRLIDDIGGVVHAGPAR